MAKAKSRRAQAPKKVEPAQQQVPRKLVPLPTPPPAIPEVAVRIGARQKKAKIVFDPADYETPPIPRKRARSPTTNSAEIINKKKTVSVSSSATTTPHHQLKNKTISPTTKLQSVRPQSSVRPPNPPIVRNPIRPESVIVKRDSIILCSICKDGKNTERKISCVDCPFKGHITCLKLNDRKDLVLLELNFQCEDCRTCSTCYDSAENEILVVCPKCFDAYHVNCHIPPIKDKQMVDGNEWCCSNCYMASRKTETKIKLNKTVPPPIEKPLPLPKAKIDKTDFVDIENPEKEENFEGFSELEQSSNDFLTLKQVPDVAKWSPKEVQKFFQSKYPAEADIFFDQEIDGAILLLMSRSDVLRLLKQRLGPAINIYRMILRFQTGSNDVTLGWF